MSAISTQEQFQEQMKARIRAAAGELMPDEMLQEIVKRGIEEAFFKPRKVFDNFNRVMDVEPWLAEFLRGELQAQVKASVNEWLQANPQAVKDILGEVVKGGAGNAVLDALTAKTRYEMEQFGQSLVRRLTGGGY